MVKWLMVMLLPISLFCTEFTASVNRNPVNAGESFTLNLTLVGGSAKGSPDTRVLNGSFLINSEQHISNFSVINGQTTSQITWRISLFPLKEGNVTIPSINLETSNGLLSTEPIALQVIKGALSENEGIDLEVNFSNEKPYKNEPILMSIKLNSQQEIANVEMQEIQLENAIVELSGEPKSFMEKKNGVNQFVVKFNYIVTPIKAGPLKIPPIIVKGGLPQWRKVHGGFDPFGMMQGFEKMKPFRLKTDEIVVEVQPPQAGINPWIAAKTLKIDEEFNPSQLMQVGEPLTRGFILSATGMLSANLPSLQQALGNDLKVYADKPELGQKVENGIVKSERKENYTLIPKEPGTLILPEIAVEWWDVENEEKAITRIPARTLQILPASALSNAPEETKSSDPAPVQRDPILYVLLAVIGMLFLIAMAWGIALKKKIDRLTGTPPPAQKQEVKIKPPPAPPKTKPAKDKKEKLPDLNPT